jgi:hypothetical protein
MRQVTERAAVLTATWAGIGGDGRAFAVRDENVALLDRSFGVVGNLDRGCAPGGGWVGRASRWCGFSAWRWRSRLRRPEPERLALRRRDGSKFCVLVEVIGISGISGGRGNRPGWVGRLASVSRRVQVRSQLAAGRVLNRHSRFVR